MNALLKLAAVAALSLASYAIAYAGEKCQARISDDVACPADWQGDKVAGGKANRLPVTVSTGELPEGASVTLTILGGD